MPTLDELQREEEALRRDEEAELQRKRTTAQHLAVQRGLAPGDPSSGGLESARTRERSRNSDLEESHMSTVQDTISPLLRSPASESLRTPEDVVPFPAFANLSPDLNETRGSDALGSGEVDSTEDERPVTAVRRDDTEEFVPARLPYFG